MHLKLYTLCLLLASGSLWPAEAQTPVFISGEVIEKGSDRHLPFAVIAVPGEKTGTKTDQRGYFRLPMITTQAHDTLVIMAVGYQPQRVAVQRADNSTWITAELTKKPQALSGAQPQSLSATTGPRTVVIGSKATKKSDGMMQGYPGTQYAFWVKNDGSASILKSVAYFVDALGFPSEPFRVRVYRAKPGGKGPGEELLTEKTVVSAPKGGQWFTVDLSKYYIAVPPDGIFVAMEWLVGGESFIAGQSNEEYTPYGQILAPTFEFKDNLTWNYTVGKPWAPLTSFDKNRVMNAMIHAELMVF